MEEQIKSQEVIIEKQEQPALEAEVLPVTEEGLINDLNTTELEIDKNKNTIDTTVGGVDRLRKVLNLPGEENNIPSIKPNEKKIEELGSRRSMLKQKLSEIVHENNVAHKYSEDLISIAEEKIDWVNSDEFARRLRLTGASDEKIAEAKSMILENINSGQPIILPGEKFKELTDIVAELSGSDYVKLAEGFHVDKEGEVGVPKYLDHSIILQEKTKVVPPPLPPLPGNKLVSSEDKTKERGKTDYVETTTMSHEMGHLAQDGLLRGEHYKNINLQTKENSPDPEYVGDVVETDTRIRSMFRELGHVFDPKKEKLTQEHLDLLRKRSTQAQDVKNLFDHYDDETIIKLANELPAI